MRNSFSYFQLAITAILAIATLVGCATIMGKSGAETLAVRSTPDRATVVITDETGTKVFEGMTPTSLPLEKKKGFFSGKTYTVTVSLAGYVDKTITVDTKANGWYIGGNLIFGGLIGWLIVDPATGAMWTLNTNELNVSLEASKPSSLLIPGASGIVVLQDVPSHLRDRMVRVQ